MIYSRYYGKEKYIIADNPTVKKTTTSIATIKATKVTYTFGTAGKSNYKSGKAVDTITLPALSATIFKSE